MMRESIASMLATLEASGLIRERDVLEHVIPQDQWQHNISWDIAQINVDGKCIAHLIVLIGDLKPKRMRGKNFRIVRVSTHKLVAIVL